MSFGSDDQGRGYTTDNVLYNAGRERGKKRLMKHISLKKKKMMQGRITTLTLILHIAGVLIKAQGRDIVDINWRQTLMRRTKTIEGQWTS